MAAILASIEAKINESLRPKPRQEETSTEKTIQYVENFTGFPRERIVSVTILMVATYVVLGNYLPFLSHLFCLFWPVKESFKVLRLQQRPSDNLLLYWIVYSLVSIFDFSSLPGIPIYYFAKIALFVSFTSNGMEKLREWSEPALRFTESWVFVVPPTHNEEDQH
uniref:Receptor expression-enhancing protein n=1 Tax=Caenorhabditis tropicalis TaxID=1561998 RepID=A0A1I7UR73_9PELO